MNRIFAIGLWTEYSQYEVRQRVDWVITGCKEKGKKQKTKTKQNKVYHSFGKMLKVTASYESEVVNHNFMSYGFYQKLVLKESLQNPWQLFWVNCKINFLKNLLNLSLLLVLKVNIEFLKVIHRKYPNNIVVMKPLHPQNYEGKYGT